MTRLARGGKGAGWPNWQASKNNASSQRLWVGEEALCDSELAITCWLRKAWKAWPYRSTISGAGWGVEFGERLRHPSAQRRRVVESNKGRSRHRIQHTRLESERAGYYRGEITGITITAPGTDRREGCAIPPARSPLLLCLPLPSGLSDKWNTRAPQTAVPQASWFALITLLPC